jgi:hypothetical protein
MKIEQLEALPRNMVGDGGSPNVFFVSQQPLGVVMITRNALLAYDYWRSLPRDVETSLEDRQWGVIADNGPEDEGSTKLVVRDDYRQFTKRKKPAKLK